MGLWAHYRLRRPRGRSGAHDASLPDPSTFSVCASRPRCKRTLRVCIATRRFISATKAASSSSSAVASLSLARNLRGEPCNGAAPTGCCGPSMVRASFGNGGFRRVPVFAATGSSGMASWSPARHGGTEFASSGIHRSGFVIRGNAGARGGDRKAMRSRVGENSVPQGPKRGSIGPMLGEWCASTWPDNFGSLGTACSAALILTRRSVLGSQPSHQTWQLRLICGVRESSRSSQLTASGMVSCTRIRWPPPPMDAPHRSRSIRLTPPS